MAWFIVSREKLDLDTELVIKYALIHDLVEVYAGDTWFFRTEAESKKKQENEAVSQERLKKEFPDFPEMHALIERYERREDPESKFIYALDKLMPVINNYLNNGKNWKEDGITWEQVWNGKLEKISISPEIKPYFEQIMTLLEHNKQMFHVEQQENK